MGGSGLAGAGPGAIGARPLPRFHVSGLSSLRDLAFWGGALGACGPQPPFSFSCVFFCFCVTFILRRRAHPIATDASRSLAENNRAATALLSFVRSRLFSSCPAAGHPSAMDGRPPRPQPALPPTRAHDRSAAPAGRRHRRVGAWRGAARRGAAPAVAARGGARVAAARRRRAGGWLVGRGPPWGGRPPATPDAAGGAASPRRPRRPRRTLSAALPVRFRLPLPLHHQCNPLTACHPTTAATRPSLVPAFSLSPTPLPLPLAPPRAPLPPIHPPPLRVNPFASLQPDPHPPPPRHHGFHQGLCRGRRGVCDGGDRRGHPRRCHRREAVHL